MDGDTNNLFTHKGRVFVLTSAPRYSCGGCVAEHDDSLCSTLPMCRDVDKFFIYKEVTDHEND